MGTHKEWGKLEKLDLSSQEIEATNNNLKKMEKNSWSSFDIFCKYDFNLSLNLREGLRGVRLWGHPRNGTSWRN